MRNFQKIYGVRRFFGKFGYENLSARIKNGRPLTLITSRDLSLEKGHFWMFFPNLRHCKRVFKKLSSQGIQATIKSITLLKRPTTISSLRVLSTSILMNESLCGFVQFVSVNSVVGLFDFASLCKFNFRENFSFKSSENVSRAKMYPMPMMVLFI